MTEEDIKKRRLLIKDMRDSADRLRESAHRASTRADMDADMRTALDRDKLADKLEIQLSDDIAADNVEIPKRGRPVTEVAVEQPKKPGMAQLFDACVSRKKAGVSR